MPNGVTMVNDMMKLSINTVSKTFYKKKSFFAKSFSSVPAVKNVTMTLDNKRIYGLVGESGSGKTTLAKIIVGLIKPGSGDIRFNDEVVMNADRQKSIRDFPVQLVFQNPFTSLNPRFTIYQILSEGLINKGMSTKEMREKINGIIAEVNLPSEVITKYPHELSGGERQRIALARALVVEPQVLILDEPLSSLDVSVQASILMLIEKVVRHRSLIVLFISHDLAVVRHIADYVFVISHGSVVEEGESASLFDNPRHDYTKTLLNAARYT